MNTPTEAHRGLVEKVFDLLSTTDMIGPSPADKAAQLIADSEARAVVEIAMVAAASADRNVSLRLERDQLRAELGPLRELVGVDSRAASNLHDIAHWRKLMDAWDENVKLRAEVECLKSDGAASAFVDMSCRASRAETDRNNLRADLDAIKSILNEEKARAERAEAELDGIRALADRRNKRYHAEDTTHQLVAALDQALDIAQAELAQFRELAIERARLDWLEENANDIMKYNCRSYIWFAHQNIRAAIDAAMKEDTK